MHQLRIEPFQPLQFGDGRAPDAAGLARTLRMPWPSTVLGALRTALAARSGSLGHLMSGSDLSVDPVIGGRTDPGSLRILGPLVCTREGSQLRLWVPRPADVDAVADADGNPILRPFLPVKRESGDGEFGDFPLVPLAPEDLRKPAGAAPFLVSWDWMMKWLTNIENPGAPWGLDVVRARNGEPVHVLGTEGRVHVTLTPGRTAEDGLLFETEHIDLADEKEAAFWISVDGTDGRSMGGMVTLGGQQGLARVVPIDSPGFPEAAPGCLPDKVAKAIRESGGYLRVILLTPGVFRSGWTPDFSGLLAGSGGMLRAAFVPRYEAVSGSRLKAKGGAEPLPARRAAAAGSVYVLKFATPDRAVEAARALWFARLSDDPEPRFRDFGLAVTGAYPHAPLMDEAWASMTNQDHPQGGN